MAKYHRKVQGTLGLSGTVEAQVQQIVNQVAPDLQKGFPKVGLSKIAEILEKILITKVADKGIDWVKEHLSEIIEKVEKILSGIDSLGP